MRRAGNDQWGPRFVDQNTVDLIDHGKIMIALVYFTEFGFHIIAQIIKAQLVVGRIGDVTAIGGVFLSLGLLWIDHTCGHAKRTIDLAHPFAVATCEIIVDRDDMDAFSGQRIEIGWKGRHKGFTLAGLHFRYIAFM